MFPDTNSKKLVSLSSSPFSFSSASSSLLASNCDPHFFQEIQSSLRYVLVDGAFPAGCNMCSSLEPDEFRRVTETPAEPTDASLCQPGRSAGRNSVPLAACFGSRGTDHNLREEGGSTGG